MMAENAIVVRDISKTFTTKADSNHEKKLFGRSEKVTRNVIENISLDIKRGEVLGIIGRNGSGKSTLLKMISMIMKPDSGTIEINGRVASILELGMGFHPDLSGRENIHIKGSMYGFTKQQIDDRIDDMIKYAELEDYIDLPIRVYSSGMTSRLAFAIMINVDADIMILDEVLSTGDISFSKKSGAHFSNMKSRGKTIIIVSHAMGTMRDMCDRVAWIDGGKIREIGAPNVVCGHYETELAESFEVIKELAESGVPASQNALGCMYRDGTNVKKSTEQARTWFEKAAGYGNEDAKINLADILIVEGKTEEREEALDLYMSAARKGNRDARNKLSRLLMQEKSDIGGEVAEDFSKLLSSGNPTVYYDYADLLMKTAWTNEEKSKALEWFQKSADHGNANAMYQISIMYRDGNGPKKDISKHLEWLKKAAENGHVLSQLTLGNMYRDGIRVESDESEAFRWYELAARNNNLDAIYQVATMYREGKGIDQNRDESDRWLRLYSEHDLLRQINILADSFSHCKNGVYDPGIGMKWYSVSSEHNNAESKYQMGMMLADSEEAEKNAPEALFLFDSAADNGHLNSAVRLSGLYGLGLAEKPALEKAMKTMDGLAKSGNAWAANILGNMYANGDVVDADGRKAVEYLKIASSSSLTGAMQKLGEMYRDGTLVERDFKESVRWFEEGIVSGNVGSAISLINMYGAGNVGEEALDKSLKSLKEMCLKGNVFAMKTLGNYYLNGIVVEADAEKAFYWYTTASKFGDSPSMHTVGEMYRDGRGTDKNEAEALKCFISA
ncbi:MAG: ATP-binding cassette domain-containing protein, partial [Bacilli bacterium]|nr:ATP-binding cassette domain-containing protein [Bacilli bacterium]